MCILIAKIPSSIAKAFNIDHLTKYLLCRVGRTADLLTGSRNIFEGTPKPPLLLDHQMQPAKEWGLLNPTSCMGHAKHTSIKFSWGSPCIKCKVTMSLLKITVLLQDHIYMLEDQKVPRY